ncbi:MAG TPA: M23 family metallopeptidase [Caulobacteraceae bacterium]|jgi:murein DD-endopeptidase MepM/ murein hydrolase activator NlpD
MKTVAPAAPAAKSLVLAALAAAALAFPALAQAQNAKSLEIRFCPSGQVRTYPLESRRDIQSLLLQNTVVVNRNAAPVQVGEVDVALMAKGVAVDEKHLSGEQLKAFAASGRKIQASGMMAVVGFQFCGDRVIEKGMTLSGPSLQPGQAMLLTYQAFAFRNARDAVRVTVRDAAGAVRGEGVIAINEAMSKTGFIWPLKGAWFAGVGPTMHTGHRWGLPEEFAFDIARIGEGDTTYRADGQTFSDYYAYGADVLAAADGKVVDIVNDAPENASFLRHPGESDDAYGGRVQEAQGGLLAKGERALAGNFVIIDHGDGEYSLYAHLQPGSVRVKPGEAVKQGQPIARLGSSGNSTEPHLHFQVCDAPQPLACAGIPIRFTNVRLPWADYPRPPQSGDLVVTD